MATEASTVVHDEAEAEAETSEPVIVATCQQTRFHISDTDKSIEVRLISLQLFLPDLL